MAASSVTGLSGNGSVLGDQKGSYDQTVGHKNIVGPKVVACGSETLSGTTGIVEIPEQTGVVGDYAVILTSNSSTYAYVSSALAAIADTDNWAFTITAGSGAAVAWVVVKKGV